jgi:hypothetical protein
MVTDCPVGLPENVIAEGSRAKTDGAANVEATNSALLEWRKTPTLARPFARHHSTL